jgi:retron-type reverse transcriptase
MLKAVRQHTDCRWVLLYVERWLKAPVQMEDGSIVPRTAGTPQGGANKSPAGESVHALLVRHVDGAEVLAHSV